VVAVNTVLTPELETEGLMREFVRSVNALRKQQKLTIHDHVTLTYHTTDVVLQAVLRQQTVALGAAVLANQLVAAAAAQTDSLQLNGRSVTVSLTL
jgi:isoleucyl-tRNA synthetase